MDPGLAVELSFDKLKPFEAPAEFEEPNVLEGPNVFEGPKVLPEGLVAPVLPMREPPFCAAASAAFASFDIS